jgi:hypothetical protein
LAVGRNDERGGVVHFFIILIDWDVRPRTGAIISLVNRW